MDLDQSESYDFIFGLNADLAYPDNEISRIKQQRAASLNGQLFVDRLLGSIGLDERELYISFDMHQHDLSITDDFLFFSFSYISSSVKSRAKKSLRGDCPLGSTSTSHTISYLLLAERSSTIFSRL